MLIHGTEITAKGIGHDCQSNRGVDQNASHAEQKKESWGREGAGNPGKEHREVRLASIDVQLPLDEINLRPAHILGIQITIKQQLTVQDNKFESIQIQINF